MHNPISIFFCSPNFGILHSWLPILKNLPESKMIDSIYFPKKRTLKNIDEKDISYKFLKKKIKKIYVKSDFNNILIFKTFKEGKSFSKKNTFNIYLNITKYIPFSKIKGLVFFLFKKYEYYFNLSKIIDFSNVIENIKFIFCDFSELPKDYYNEIKFKIFDKKIFSLNHGSGIQIEKKNYFPNYFNNFKELYIFVWSNIEKKIYQSKYKKIKNKIFTTAIPKHKIQNFKSNKISKKIILFSRNFEENFFPLKEKVFFLKIIKKIIIDANGFYLCIKRHPDEIEEKNHNDIFYSIFDKKMLKKNWEFIEDPKIYQNNYFFGITFISSTCLDLIASKIPAIELFNVRKKMFNPNFRRNKKYLTKYSYFKFVINMNSANELNKFIKKLHLYRNQIILKQLHYYFKIYQYPTNKEFKVLKIINKFSN